MAPDDPGAVAARVLTWDDNDRCTICHVDPTQLICAVEKASRQDKACLVIVDELSDAYQDVLQSNLGIDPEFMSAHIRRRTYYPVERQKCTFSHLDYPEAVSVVKKNQNAPPSMPFCPTSHGGRGVVFCRASSWTLSTDAQAKNMTKVILLDNPAYEFHPQNWESRLPDKVDQQDRFPFRRHLDNILEGVSTTKPSDDTFRSIDAVIESQWLKLLDTMDFNMEQGFIAPLIWQIHQSLEMNYQSASDRHSHLLPRGMMWDRLLQRIARTGQMLSQFRPANQAIITPYIFESTTAEQAVVDSAKQRPTAPSEVVLDETYLDEKQPMTTDEEDNFQATNINPLNPNPNNATGDLSPADENQRSLERLSYLGGVLLPFSIVSGILSMNDDYSPTGPLFFIYWAATIPLTIIALVVIYADSIRKSEVWVEVVSVAGATGHASSILAGSNPDVIAGPLPPTMEESEGRLIHGDLETGLQVPIPPVAASPAWGGEVAETITYSETIPADPRMTHSDTALEVVDDNNDNHQSIADSGGDEQQGLPGTPAVIDDRIIHDPRMARNHPHRHHHSNYNNGPVARKWKKQQLGWFGACKTILGVQPWGKARNGNNEGEDGGVDKTDEIYYRPGPTGRRVYSAGTGAQFRGRGRGIHPQ